MPLNAKCEVLIRIRIMTIVLFVCEYQGALCVRGLAEIAVISEPESN
jgi:hypothetical protein